MKLNDHRKHCTLSAATTFLSRNNFHKVEAPAIAMSTCPQWIRVMPRSTLYVHTLW